jgi:diacylglycerol kinase
MNKKNKFSIKQRLKSFTHAFRGLKSLFREEHNAKIHLGIGLVLFVLNSILKLKKMEVIAVLLSIGLVIMAESFNSAIEKLSDVVQPNRDDRIRKIKDISAAAVLISAITAFGIGLIVYFPYLERLFESLQAIIL